MTATPIPTLLATAPCQHRQYSVSHTGDKSIDVVLIPKRSAGVAPVRLQTDIDRYKAGKIWWRQGAEVLEASSREIPILYGARSSDGIEQNASESRVHSVLPPPPSTVTEFIGRTSVLDKLFDWFVDHEDCRRFLWGKGGSGKSTIAYEFAHIVAQQGRDLVLSDGRPIDSVLYFSAKEVRLNTVSGKVEPNKSLDFSSAVEFYRLLLACAEWMSLDEVEKLSEKDLKVEIRALVDLNRLLIVVDDVDSLTTRGVDPGMDFLFTTVVRSKSGGKLLYTQRGLPSGAIESAIEVPGLSDAGERSEYDEFIRASCTQFDVPVPTREFSTGPLNRHSERRPLRYEDIDLMRVLSDMEQRSGFGGVEAEAICRLVISGKTYTKLQKAEFLRRLGALYYFRARDEAVSNPIDSLDKFEDALAAHLCSFTALFHEKRYGLEKGEEYCRNTAFAYAQVAARVGEPQRVLSHVSGLRRESVEGTDGPILLDPIVEPLKYCLATMRRSVGVTGQARIPSVIRKFRTALVTGRTVAIRDEMARNELVSMVEAVKG